MTEFRKASAAVDTVEKGVLELVAAETVDEALRARFAEVAKLLEELAPTAEKMNRKCQARAELEALKVQLREQLPGAPEESVKAAQEVVDAEGENADTLRPLVDKAAQLEGLATYGVKMVDKVQDLLARFDVVQGQFKMEVAPRLGDTVAAAAAEDERRRAETAREEAAAAEATAKAAEEAIRRPLVEMMAQNEAAEKKKREEQEAEERKRKEEEEAAQRATAVFAEETEALRRAEHEGEIRLREIGPDVACGEALVNMLAAPTGAYRAAVEALHLLLGGVAEEPQDMRHRVLRLSNAVFQEQMGRRPGVWLFLRSVGYGARDRQALPEGVGAALGLGAAHAEERFLYLGEPDMFNAYDAWTVWHKRITCIAGFLESLERLAFQRTAHLGVHGLDVPAHSVISATEIQKRWEETRGGFTAS